MVDDNVAGVKIHAVYLFMVIALRLGDGQCVLQGIRDDMYVAPIAGCATMLDVYVVDVSHFACP